MKSINFKELGKGLLTICSYLILSIILQIPFLFLSKNYIIFFSNLLLCIVFIRYFIKTLKEDSKSLKREWQSILITTIKYWLLGLTIMIISSFIITKLNIPVNTTNQEANINLLKANPILASIVMIVFAPITEELVFRRGLIKFTSNKHIYAIISGVIFALLHLTSSISSINDIIMIVHIIPYSAAGIAFAYSYYKTKNIYGTIIIHALHNTISVIGILFSGGIL